MKYTLYLELNFFSPISFFFFMNWSQFSVRHIAKCYLNLLLQYCVQQHNNLFFGRIKAVFPFTLFAFHNLKNDRRVDSTQYYGTKWGMHQGCHPSTWKVDMKNGNESNTNLFQYQKSSNFNNILVSGSTGVFFSLHCLPFWWGCLQSWPSDVSPVLSIGTKFLKQYENQNHYYSDKFSIFSVYESNLWNVSYFCCLLSADEI